MPQPILLQQLATQMMYTTERQGVLAQNMSNIDTPAYKAQDLVKPDFERMAKNAGASLTMASSGGKSMSGTLSTGGHFKEAKVRKPFEVAPSGNNVVLEEQMAKISDTGAQFSIASSLYKKYNSLYNISLGKNG